ncbi:MAG: hypothetical protein ACYC7H_16540 [Chloroflexota bacterium]
MKRLALRVVTAVAVISGFAFVWLPGVTAGTGDLLNPGFETGDTTGWEVDTWAPQGVSVVGSEDLPNFFNYTATGTVRVAPHEGRYMARLGKPSDPYGQTSGMNPIWQDFTVMASALSFAYNLCSYDAAPNDYFDFKVALPGAGGDTIIAYFGTTAPAGNAAGALVCGGWQEQTVDLSPYIGKLARLYFSAGGNGSAGAMRASFAYVDTLPSAAPRVVTAAVTLTPRSLNPADKGEASVVTAHLELPAGAGDVDLASVNLMVGATKVAALERPIEAGEHLTFKFSHQALLAAIGDSRGEVAVTLSGALVGGESFTGVDTVWVIATKAK